MSSMFHSTLGSRGGARSNRALWAKQWRVASAIATTVMLAANPVHAADSYQTGHITRVSYTADSLIIMLDSGPPTNCAGSAYGWMMVPAANKPMLAFVTGLWMRGDAAAESIVVYTNPTDSSGFCQISQLDTQSAGG